MFGVDIAFLEAVRIDLKDSIISCFLSGFL